MNESEVLSILTDWNYWGTFRTRHRERPDYLKRMEQLFSERSATILLGVRRSGKSSLIYLFMQQCLEKKFLDVKDTLIINFEDPRFYLPLSSTELFNIYEIYIKHLDPSQPLVVLDEVQNIQGWEKFVRFLLETKKAYVMITGSSSKLLGQELSTVLTGRHLDIEVFPLSYKEFLHFKDLNIIEEVDIAKHRVKIKRYLDEYAEWGGFPEVVLSTSIVRKRELLIRYFDDIVIKDVVKRFGIKEIEKLERLANIFISNFATLQSFNKLKNVIATSLDTIERFSKYLQISRMFFFLKKFDYSLAKQIRSVNKIYVIDSGLYTVKGFKFSENLGRIAENIVAIELFRKRSIMPQLEIFYWKDYQNREVDFVVKDGLQIKQLIQACWDVSDQPTKKRETNSLIKASTELNCRDLLVITHDYEATEALKWNGIERTIRFLPLWRWLLTSDTPSLLA
ncbi:MAG: ATP-binding protein [bacterium]